jgi:hypothetical protein
MEAGLFLRTKDNFNDVQHRAIIHHHDQPRMISLFVLTIALTAAST